MVVSLNPALKGRNAALFSRQAPYRRKSGKIKTKRIQRKFRIRFWHILFHFLVLFGLFYGIHKAYIHLISWEGLTIRKVEVICEKAEIRDPVLRQLSGITYGNILLFDINRLQNSLAPIHGIKDIRIKKVFPPALLIEIRERTPIAVLERNGRFLVDEDGVVLGQISDPSRSDLPLLIDRMGFKSDYEMKLAQAWKCLDSFNSTSGEHLEILDLTDPQNLMVRLKGSLTWLKLGQEGFAEKYRSYQLSKNRLSEFGPLDYVDLRFEDRFYIKKGTPKAGYPSQNKEAN